MASLLSKLRNLFLPEPTTLEAFSCGYEVASAFLHLYSDINEVKDVIEMSKRDKYELLLGIKFYQYVYGNEPEVSKLIDIWRRRAGALTSRDTFVLKAMKQGANNLDLVEASVDLRPLYFEFGNQTSSELNLGKIVCFMAEQSLRDAYKMNDVPIRFQRSILEGVEDVIPPEI